MHTKLRAERKVALALERRGIELFLPERRSVSKGEPEKTSAFFPGYLFMRVDLVRENHSQWRWEPGVRYLVAYGDQPVPLPDEVIHLLRHRLAAGEEQAKYQFKKGDIVRIKAGPFADILAVFEGTLSAEQRVAVLLEFMGRLSRVQVEIDNLEPVSAATQVSAPKRRRGTRGRGRRIKYENS